MATIFYLNERTAKKKQKISAQQRQLLFNVHLLNSLQSEETARIIIKLQKIKPDMLEFFGLFSKLTILYGILSKEEPDFSHTDFAPAYKQIADKANIALNNWESSLQTIEPELKKWYVQNKEDYPKFNKWILKDKSEAVILCDYIYN
jgi:hypothetical protein